MSDIPPDRLLALWNLRSVLAGVAAKKRRQMAKPKGRCPWERIAGESRKHYSWFIIYRNLGPERTIKCAASLARDERVRYGQAAWNTLPKRAQDSIWSYWRRIASKWQWKQRAEAWDDYRAALAQKHANERAIKAAIKEAEEAEAERQRQIEAGKKSVAAGLAVVRRIVDLFDSGGIEKLKLERIKTVVVAENGSRAEQETKAITELLSGALAAIAEGQRIQRIAQEQVTERKKVEIDLSGIDRLADIIIARVPVEEREVVLAELAAVLRGEPVAIIE